MIIKENGDLALAEYARVGRAITLYEVGDKEEAFVEMEDASLSLKGYPGEPDSICVHACIGALINIYCCMGTGFYNNMVL